MPAGVSAWTPLANLTLGSSAATVTFSSISQSYRDLALVINARTDRSGQATDGLNIKFNTDDGNNYYDVYMTGNGSSVASSVDSAVSRWLTHPSNLPGATATSGEYSSIVTQFLDYSATDKHKTGLCRFDLASAITGASAGRWANTAAVTQLVLISRNNANFVAGSTFALYGVSS